MDGFGSDFSAGGSGGKMDTGTIMEQVKVQIAVANAQELLQRMTDKCFKKCIGKPGSTLDNSEQKCIAMCMDRYMDAWNTVSRTYNSRLQRERARMWAPPTPTPTSDSDCYEEHSDHGAHELWTGVSWQQRIISLRQCTTDRQTAPYRQTDRTWWTSAITMSWWTF